MSKIVVNGIEKDIDLVVFDKDGLMFKSQIFWSEIGNERLFHLKKYLNDSALKEWARVFGLTLDANGKVTYTDPRGIFAVASPKEEITVTAGLLIQSNNYTWEKALCCSQEVYKQADESLDFSKALVPNKGFPLIFDRLRSAGIKVAIATSDSTERTLDSLKLFSVEPPEVIVVTGMVQHGKPAPDMLLHAAKLCNVPIERTAMVGDSYVDVKMAHEAGGFGIGIPENDFMREEMKPYASVIADSLDDILIC